MEKLLKVIEKNAKLTSEEIALMLGKEEGDVREMIDALEREGVILGYRTVVDWDKAARERVSALIEVKVMPQHDGGFDKIADKIKNYPEITALYLMSGAYDFAVVIEGTTMKEVAFVVARKLATIDAVTATATHFVLKKYKDEGTIFDRPEKDPRENLLI